MPERGQDPKDIRQHSRRAHPPPRAVQSHICIYTMPQPQLHHATATVVWQFCTNVACVWPVQGYIYARVWSGQAIQCGSGGEQYAALQAASGTSRGATQGLMMGAARAKPAEEESTPARRQGEDGADGHQHIHGTCGGSRAGAAPPAVGAAPSMLGRWPCAIAPAAVSVLDCKRGELPPEAMGRGSEARPAAMTSQGEGASVQNTQGFERAPDPSSTSSTSSSAKARGPSAKRSVAQPPPPHLP
jgi:hypothetical protein